MDITARVSSGSHLVNVQLGRYSYIGDYCTVIDVEIGNYCSIASNCTIGGLSHPIDWVSSSPVFHKGKNILRRNFSEHPFDTGSRTLIGNDVWVGSNCLIKGGIKIENGAIIGMGSVLTKNVGPYEIWGGNPAKLIRKRFSDEIIEKLLESSWWDWDDKTLAERAKYFNDIKSFVNLKEGNEG